MQIYGVRKGFVVGALAGFSLAGSTLWALTSVQQMLHPTPLEGSRYVSPTPLPIARPEVPPQWAWFFIAYPYVSDRAAIRSKGLHAAVITDAPRGKEYVVSFGQTFRRVEIYSTGNTAVWQIHVYTPGRKRLVFMERGRITGESSKADGNLWMWNSPLWTPRHIKIYGLADFWLNSPFKRFSCAGFVHTYLGEAGVQVPVLDAWDMAKLPYTKVSMDEMEPGDIIAIKAASPAHRAFWGHSITHVGVYIGHGKFIHAATATHKAKRSFIRLSDVKDIRPRIAKVLRPPELL